MDTTLLEYYVDILPSNENFTNGSANNNTINNSQNVVIGDVFKIINSVWPESEIKFQNFNRSINSWTALIFNTKKHISFLMNILKDGLMTIDITATKETLSDQIVMKLENQIKQQSFVKLPPTGGFTRIPTLKRGRAFSCYDSASGRRLVEYDFDKVVLDKMSEYQHVKIMHSTQYGNCLFLDNDMNMSESDLPYTIAITGSHSFCYDNATVLILGGGDGGILHYLRKNYNPRYIVMIDIDQVVIDASRKYLRGIAHDSLDVLKGENYEVIVDDCVKHLKLYVKNGTKFDFVINDLTAIPVSTTTAGKQWDFLRLILQLSMDVLTKTGVFLTQVAAYTDTESLELYNQQLSSLKYNIEYKSEVVCVPSYLEQFYSNVSSFTNLAMNKEADASEAIFRLINPDDSEKVYKTDALNYIDQKAKGEDEHDLKNPQVHKPLLNVLTPKDIDSINKRYLSGHAPRLKQSKADDHDHACDENYDDNAEVLLSKKEHALAKVYNFVVKSGNTIKVKSFNIASKAGRAWLFRLIPTQQISTLTTFFLLTYVVNAQFLSYFVPLTLLSVSVIIMFIATMRMLRGKQRFEEVRNWSILLTLIPGTENIDVTAAEKTYVFKHLTPYIQFMCSLCVALLAYATGKDICFFNAEIFLISLVLYASMIVVFQIYTRTNNCIVLAAFFVASVLEGFNRFDGYFAGGIISSIPVNFINATVNVSISVLIRFIGFIMIFQSYKNSKLENKLLTLYAEIGPLLVTLLWWEFGTLFFAQSTLTGIIRAGFELSTLVFALPVLALIVAYSIIKFIISVNLKKIILTVVLLAIPFVYAKLTKTNLKKIFYNIVSNTTVQIILTVIAVVGIVIGMLYYNPHGLQVKDSSLQWNTYNNLCAQTNPWANDNFAEISLDCEEFKRYHIHWNGFVKSVRLSSSENKLLKFLNNLPASLANWILCVYGTPFPTEEECKAQDFFVSKHLCGIAKASERKCHIIKYSTLSFTITVAMTNKSDARTLDLVVGNDFKDVVFSLKTGNKIGFEGKITSTRPVVKGRVIYEYTREGDEPEEHLKKIADIKQELDTQFRSASRFILRFLFFPLLAFD